MGIAVKLDVLPWNSCVIILTNLNCYLRNQITGNRVPMIKFKFQMSVILVILLYSQTAFAEKLICPDFVSEIEPDMQRDESDFTAESYRNAKKSLEDVIPMWMERAFEQNKKFPDTYDNLFQGDIWLSYANSNAAITGYVLKLEYQSALPEDKEEKRIEFCKFVIVTPYYD
jgi:hypothetical protein